MSAIRVLLVDDSTHASLIRRALEGLSGIQIIGRASTAREALPKIQEEKPDLVTLNLEISGNQGLNLLRVMKRQGLKTSVALIGATEPDAMVSVQGAHVDFIRQPQGLTGEARVRALRESLAPLVAAADYRNQVRSLLKGAPEALPPAATPHDDRLSVAAAEETGAPRKRAQPGLQRPLMVLIGASTGGTEALAHVIPQLPGNFPVPVLVVQHMPPMFTQNLANSLKAKSRLDVREARSGETAHGGCVYIAPGGNHLKVSAGPAGEIRLRITSDPPENNCRPAVDYLFRSAASAFPGRCVAAILTGMGRDGTSGLQALKAGGCLSIAQNESTCTVFGMPKEAILAGVVDVVAPLDSIAGEIAKAVR